MLYLWILACLSLAVNCTPMETAVFQPLPREVDADVIASNATHEIVLTAEEIHDNVLLNYPADLITESTLLTAFIGTHPGLDELVYLKDTREFVEPGAIPVLSARSLQGKRTPQKECIPGNPHYTHKVLMSRTFWYPFQPASSCAWTENNAGSVGEESSYTVSISGNGGVALSSLTGIIGASIGFEVGVSFTKTQNVACDIPAHSVGRVWARKNMVWSELRTTLVDPCVEADPYTHWAAAPIKGSDNANLQWKCRTGRQAVACG